jgi:hypothetical protein
MQELLWSEKGINWNDYPDGCKRGRLITKRAGQRPVTFTHKRTQEEQTVTAERTWWEAAGAPHFTVESLAELIPVFGQPAVPAAVGS